MPNYAFLARFKPQKPPEQKKLKHNILHLGKSPNRDHIYTLGLFMIEEHNCLILTS